MFATILKFNPNHEAAGSSRGGEFARGANSPFGKFEESLKSATDHVLRGQKADGFEHAQVFDADGKMVVTAYGSKTSIDFTRSELDAMRPGMTLVHNHPNGSSLSGADMMLAGQKKMTIYAVTDTGSKFWSSGFKGNRNTVDLQMISQKVQAKVQEALKVGEVERPDASVLVQHVINLIAQKRGIIDYHFSLSKNVQEALGRNSTFYTKLVQGSEG